MKFIFTRQLFLFLSILIIQWQNVLLNYNHSQCRLFLNEDVTHDTDKEDENKAIIELDKPGREQLKEWVMSECTKVVTLFMIANAEKANLYFESAEISGFTKMFIIKDYEIKRQEYKMYPMDDPCCVTELLNRYDNKGNMVEEGESLDMTKADWFFCYPKPETSKKCCEIM